MQETVTIKLEKLLNRSLETMKLVPLVWILLLSNAIILEKKVCSFFGLNFR